MSGPTPGPWTYGVRADGSIWMSLGDPQAGAHHQFDWYGTETDARYAVAAKNLAAALELLLRDIEPMEQAAGVRTKSGDVARAALARARGETL